MISLYSVSVVTFWTMVGILHSVRHDAAFGSQNEDSLDCALRERDPEMGSIRELVVV